MTRHIDFDEIQNFRDFGGYATASGRPLRSGRLYRSANHSRATDLDLARLRELGIAVVVDLRQPREREREPSRRWEGFAAAVIENHESEQHPDWESAARAAPELTAEWFFQDALAFYGRTPFEPRYVDLFSRYFRTLAETDGAVVVHCAAGKDRTGMICALTHHLAGVGRDDLVADYLLTNDESRLARKIEVVTPWFEKAFGRRPSDDALRVLVSVQPEYLANAFAVMEARHGSIDGYLEAVLGVDAAMRERIHERLLA